MIAFRVVKINKICFFSSHDRINLLTQRIIDVLIECETTINGLMKKGYVSDIPHIKIMRANNSELFYQQVQIMIFIQLKQGFFLRKSRICWEHEMDRTENHPLETAIPCFAQKGFELPCTAS